MQAPARRLGADGITGNIRWRHGNSPVILEISGLLIILTHYDDKFSLAKPAPKAPLFPSRKMRPSHRGNPRGTERASGTSLRVAVDAGGCNGFQYRFKLDGTRHDDDIVIEQGDVSVIVDETSMSLLSRRAA